LAKRSHVVGCLKQIDPHKLAVDMPRHKDVEKRHGSCDRNTRLVDPGMGTSCFGAAIVHRIRVNIAILCEVVLRRQQLPEDFCSNARRSAFVQVDSSIQPVSTG
jgi:hypothetical protein